MRLGSDRFAIALIALFTTLMGCAADSTRTIDAPSPSIEASCVTTASGLFNLVHVGLHDAEFIVVRCDATKNRIVRVEDDRDIRLAVVRRIIDIIRETHPAAFEWRSGECTLTLSAKSADQPILEAFLLGNFFPRDARGISIESLTKDCHATCHEALPLDP